MISHIVCSTNLESMTFCLRSDRFLGSHLGICTGAQLAAFPALLPLQMLSPLWFESVRINRSPPQRSSGERCCKNIGPWFLLAIRFNCNIMLHL